MVYKRSVSVELLVECIQGFASQGSNPVLSVLQTDQPLENNKRYPEPILTFCDAGLKAYYHCHPSVSRPEGEHGHFHIFVGLADQQWSHVAGLSMDRQGQPLQWFTVNHWVTGEEWAEPQAIVTAVKGLSDGAGLSLTEAWLWHMLHFYLPTIYDLLEIRNQHITSLSRQGQDPDVLQDRDIYLLSCQAINLFQDLEREMAATS